MHAIILVIDEMDRKKVKVKSGLRQRLYKLLFKKPLIETRECFYFRNCFINKVKRLLKYLRKDLFFTKNQITFLRSSRYRDSRALLKKLNQVCVNCQNEDVLFYYTGHGNYKSWGSGRKSRKIDLRFSDLVKTFQLLKGRFIIISESCEALAIEPYLRGMVGRYLLLGCSRKKHDGAGNYSILNFILSSWAGRKIARLEVFMMEKTIASGNVIDVPFGSRHSGIKFSSCNCDDRKVRVKSFYYPLKRRPSLRRGAPLDYLCFPPR